MTDQPGTGMEAGTQGPITQAPQDAGGPGKDERMWGMLCHLVAFAGYFVPFGNIIGPLVIWLIKREQYPFVEDQGKESLNFQISMSIYFVVSFILIYVIIGIITTIGLLIAQVVLIIMASIRANEGQQYRYPVTIRFIK
jgi:uncharacterized Tic20 family protein